MSVPAGASFSSPPLLVTGATGYIGGRLVPRLLEAGYRVRCAARAPEKLSGRPWAADPRVEIVRLDLDAAAAGTDGGALRAALRDCAAAYYLVHSMLAAGAAYAAHDRALARAFAHDARAAGVGRIIYLGGLGELGEGLSEHLSSRQEVERELAASGVPVTVLRAAMIIGSGSASFEILRYLVERLPVMVTPRWVTTECQPIAVRNVLDYLVACLSVPETIGHTLDIGGTDVLTYVELMHIMAEELGLRRRLVVPVPVLTPRLSSHWIQFVTPLSRHIARPLAEGLRNRVVCRNDDAQRLMPQDLLSAREAVRAALAHVSRGDVETVWSAAGPMPGDPDWSGGRVFVNRRERTVAVSPEALFAAVRRVGGTNGWYFANWLWRLRGFLDRLAGGPGLRRGRRDPEALAPGEAVDFWRVVAFEQGRLLRLHAEMKLPGEAELQFEVSSAGAGARLVQTARFRPRGLAGLAYWYSVLPLHGLVFDGLADGICRAASRRPLS